MGSLFYITVPTREHEIELRKREQNIVLGKELGNASFSGRKTLSSVESDVDIYEGTMEGGKKINILVTQNTFEIQAKMESSGGPSSEVALEEKNAEVLKKKRRQYAINCTFLEKHLEEFLKEFVIYDGTWATSITNDFAQISFTVNADRTDEITNHLLSLGIGQKYESKLCVFSTCAYYSGKMEDKKKEGPLEAHGVHNYESKLSVSSTSAHNNEKLEDKKEDEALEGSGVVEIDIAIANVMFGARFGPPGNAESETVSEVGTPREPSMHPNPHHHHTASPGFLDYLSGFFGNRGNAESDLLSEDGTPNVSPKPSVTSKKR